MSKRILSIICICISLLSLAQGEVELTFLDFEVEKAYDPKLITYAKSEDGNYIILKKEPIRGPGGYRYYLEVRDPKMNKISVRDVSAELDGDTYTFDQLLLLNGKLVVFSSLLFKAENKEEFYYQSIDINSLEISGRESFYELTYEKRRRRPRLDIQASDNKEYFLVTVHPPYKRKEEERFTLQLLDKDLNSIWKMPNYILEVEDRDYVVKKVLVGNNGEAFMLGEHISDAEDSQYDLFRFDADGVKSEKVEFEQNVVGMTMAISSSNELFLTGYYTDLETRGIKGVFYRTFSTDQLVEQDRQTTAYSEEMLFFGDAPKTQTKAKKRAERKDYEIGVHDLKMNTILFDKDNNFYLIGSQFRLEVTTYTDANGNTRTRYTYYYDDIYVTKFDSNGEHIYDAKIPKSFVSGRPMDPYTWLINENELSFVFYDNKINLEGDMQIKAEGVKRPGRFKDNTLTIATVDGSGSVVRKELYNIVDNHKKFVIHKVVDGVEDAMMMVYVGSKKFQLGIIKPN